VRCPGRGRVPGEQGIQWREGIQDKGQQLLRDLPRGASIFKLYLQNKIMSDATNSRIIFEAGEVAWEFGEKPYPVSHLSKNSMSVAIAGRPYMSPIIRNLRQARLYISRVSDG